MRRTPLSAASEKTAEIRRQTPLKLISAECVLFKAVTFKQAAKFSVATRELRPAEWYFWWPK